MGTGGSSPAHKLAICDACGAMVARTARVCPQCGVRRSGERPGLALAVTLAAVLVVVLAAVVSAVWSRTHLP